MKKHFIIFSFLLFSIINLKTNLQAQKLKDIRFGATIGVGGSTIKGKEGGNTFGSRDKDTPMLERIILVVGMLADMPLKKRLSVQAGLQYKNAGYNYDGADFKDQLRVNYLTMPVNLRYNLFEKNNVTFYVYGGLYVAGTLGGKIITEYKQTYGTKTTPLYFGNDRTRDFAKKIDFGHQYGIGIESDGFCLNITVFDKSIINIQPQGNSDNSMRNSSVTMSVGYFFSKKNSVKTL